MTTMNEHGEVHIKTSDDAQLCVARMPKAFDMMQDQTKYGPEFTIEAFADVVKEAAEKAYSRGRQDYENELKEWVNRNKRYLF